MTTHPLDLMKFVKPVQNFPKEGILFRDIAPLLASPEALEFAVNRFRVRWEGHIDGIAALDARGFLFGGLLAVMLRVPLVMVRKPGKLPGDVVTLKYDLEYGSNELQVQKNAFDPGSRVLVIDDVLATGGTAGATAELIALIDSHVVGYAFVIELEYLNGRTQLGSIPVQSLCVYTDGSYE